MPAPVNPLQKPQQALNPLRDKPIDPSGTFASADDLRALVGTTGAPPPRAPEPPPEMGPYASPTAGDSPTSTKTWSGGPLGRVPNHHGWAGLQEPAKQWALRTLGQFPSLHFSSGYRTPEENARANGAPNSGHMSGWKIDVGGPTKDLYAAAAWAKQMGAKTLLHDAGSGFHLDISWQGVPA